MSMKVTKVYGSVDENNGLEYTVDDKSLGLLSTTIDKALGSMLKSEEAQLKCSPEYAEGAIIDLTLLQKAEKAISDKTVTEKAVVEKAAEEKVAIAKKSTVANVAVEEVATKTKRIRTRRRYSRLYQGTSWTVSIWKKSECTQDSWVASVSKWFAEDTGLQTAEDSKFFGIASSIESFSNEGKELIIQQPETSYAAHTGQFGQIVGMLEQMLSHIQSDL